MENKNRLRTIYWALTLPVALMMLALAYGYLTSAPQLVEAIGHLGYPLYFMTLLGTAKLLGAAAILYGRFRTLAEWAYAGFAFTLISAAFSHFSLGDGPIKVMIPLVVLGLLLVSYHYRRLMLASRGVRTPSDAVRTVRYAHDRQSAALSGTRLTITTTDGTSI